jgi:hypothetical protein
MSDFMKFSSIVDAAANTLYTKYGKDNLYRVDVTGDALWDHYLKSFPEGTNPMFRERTEYDCSCCRNFVKNIGNLVAIDKNGNIISVWDGEVDHATYDVVSKAMSSFVKSKKISQVFCVSEPRYGAEVTPDAKLKINWNHFYTNIPKALQLKNLPSNYVGIKNENVAILKRSILEITDDAVDVAVELIKQGSLYRGTEFLATVKELKKLKAEYNKLKNDDQRHLFFWQNATMNTRFRGTVIGTLLCDLSDGVDLEQAVASFEAKVAPANYKRPKALVTQKMIDGAKKKVEELGIEESLYRRHAKKSDISVENVLFVDGQVKPKLIGGAFDNLKPNKTNVPEFKGVEEIFVEDFIEKVLPSAKSVELFVKNNLRNNFVTLTAPVYPDAAPLFKWGNGFSWSYNGDLTDSGIREAVQERGGRVDGVLRFSHSWNYDKRNASLMDLHVFMPGCHHESGCHDNYGSRVQRVGWNNRNDHTSGGVQDVDYVNEAPVGYVPVENITFPSLSRLKDGEYKCKIHNWRLRSPTEGGFKAEIEFEGTVFEYEYVKPLKNKEWVDVATVTLKNGKFNIEHHLPVGAASINTWGVQTENWVPVDMVMKSPNFWDGNSIGNEHLFFMLKDCKNPEAVRGFYNEFLRGDLNEHRKVLELLASNMKAEYTDEQLSGVGISMTKQETVTVRVKGSINRVLNVVF